MTLQAPAPAGPLLTTRAELVAMLEAAGIRTHEVTDGRVATPCVLVDPGAPWSTRAAMVAGAREVRWRVTVLAARIDNAASLDLLADTVDAVCRVLDSSRDWGSDDVASVRALELGGATYLAADVTALTTYTIRR
jgi:hypothetical protein